VDTPAATRTNLTESAQEVVPVGIVSDDGFASIAAIEEVIDRAGKFDAGLARHGRVVDKKSNDGRGKCQDSWTDPFSFLLNGIIDANTKVRMQNWYRRPVETGAAIHEDYPTHTMSYTVNRILNEFLKPAGLAQ
jgi:hypothetical protein